jgi:hypothetical protein
MTDNCVAPESSVHCTLQKIQDLNGYPPICTFLANNLDHIWFAQHHTTCQLMASFGAKGLMHSVAHMTGIRCIVAIPLQALVSPKGSRRLRFPDYKTVGTLRWQGCQHYTLATFTLRKYSWYSFLLEAESTPGP